MKRTEAKPGYYEALGPEERELGALILRRRLQILVASSAYEDYGETIISDREWDMRAKELAALQNSNPGLAAKLPWSEAFSGWTGDTGAGLPLREPWVSGTARYLIQLHQKSESI